MRSGWNAGSVGAWRQFVKWMLVIRTIQAFYGATSAPGPEPAAVARRVAGRAPCHAGGRPAGLVAACTVGAAQAVARCVRRSPARAVGRARHDAHRARGG